nr:hypothetical protein 8 [Desulfobacterales bacterium]
MGMDAHVDVYGQEFAQPARFLERKLGISLWRKQAEILAAVRDHRRVAVRSCNGSGKTFTAACAVIWWLMAVRESAIAITTAPTERQVKELLWREIRDLHRGSASTIGGTLTHTGLDIAPGRYARGFSTDAPERFQGFHDDNILFVVDEASGVSEEIFEAIEGSMTTDGARLLLIGNPNNRYGTFFDAFHSRRSLWHTIHISAFDTPNVRTSTKDNVESGSGNHSIPGLVRPRWVDEAARQWGRDHPVYQVRVLGEFPSQAEDTLIPLHLVEQAMGRVAGGGVA